MSVSALVGLLRELEAKASPGPWQLRCCPRHEAEGKRVAGCMFVRGPSGARISQEDDLAFVAMARNVLPGLLDERESLKALLAKARDLMTEMASGWGADPIPGWRDVMRELDKEVAR